jgi:hypothetical protein
MPEIAPARSAVSQLTWMDQLHLAGWPGFIILALGVALLALFVMQMAGRRGFRSIAAYCVFSLVPGLVGMIGSAGSLRRALVGRHARGISGAEDDVVFHQVLSESLIALQFGSIVTLLGLCGAAILAWKGSAKLVSDY